MGNTAAGPLVAGGGQQSPRLFIKRDESFGSKSPRRSARHAVILNRSGPEEWTQETAMAIRTGRGSGSAASEGRNGAGSAAALGLRFVNRSEGGGRRMRNLGFIKIIYLKAKSEPKSGAEVGDRGDL